MTMMTMMTAVAVVIVVLGALAVTGWQEHWPPALFRHAASSAGAAAAAAHTLTWTATGAPLPAGAAPNAALSAAACPADGACMAAGGYEGQGSGSGALTETVSGGQWLPGTPVPAGTASFADATLNALTCPGPGSCTAAGDYLDTGSNHYVGLIDTLSGANWTPSRLSLPTAAGRDQEMEIDGIACPAPSNCIAVGSNWYNASTGPGRGLAMTQSLTSGTWTAADAPLPGDAAKADAANATLHAIACTAPGACVAVGSYTSSNGSSNGLIETLAHGTWTPARAPLPSGAVDVQRLNGIACTAPGSCVAVGIYAANNETLGLIETFTHGTWTPAQAPLPTGAPRANGSALWGISCATRGSCVAVGDYTTGKNASNSQGLTEELANRTWIPARSPLPGNAARTSPGAGLFAVACATPGNCVAAGDYTDSSKHDVAMLETTGVISKIIAAGIPSASATASSPAQPAESTTTAPASVITPGNDTPEDATEGLIQAELAGNWAQACSYVVPSSQPACEQDASQLPAFTGNATVDGDVVSGSEALVEVTGSMCAEGNCTSNSDPSTGMPDSQESFAQAYDQALSSGNSAFSPVPCIEENGEWYIDHSQ